MAYFTPEELPDNKYYIFGQGGKKLAEKGKEYSLAKYHWSKALEKEETLVTLPLCKRE